MTTTDSRATVLEVLYELAEADHLKIIEFSDVVDHVGLPEDDVETALWELVAEGMAQQPESGPVFSISHHGIRRAEAAILDDPGHRLFAVAQERMDDRIRLLQRVADLSGFAPDTAVDVAGFGLPPDRLWATAHYLDSRGFLAVVGHSLALTRPGIRLLRDSGTDPTMRI